jgi:hypothetical protein
MTNDPSPSPIKPSRTPHRACNQVPRSLTAWRAGCAQGIAQSPTEPPTATETAPSTPTRTATRTATVTATRP